MAQPAFLQRLPRNGSSRSSHGTLSSTSAVQSHVFFFNCSAISCLCDCIASKLFQPRALPSLSHHLVETCKDNLLCLCVQPYLVLPVEKVDTSPASHQPPRISYLTILPTDNSTHSMPTSPPSFSDVPPTVLSSSVSPSLGRFPLPRSVPNLNPISNWESKLVVNLSLASIDSLTFNFLKRGLNFALTPRNIPHIDFLIEIKNAVRALPLDVAEEVRQDCVVALCNAKSPKCNIPKAKMLVFNNLMRNNDLIISREEQG
ncbi:hypothetical protein SUGI_0030200 [Cryptomeria japonica]|nr:hypothetical protein SUGI_0030200 [Cryptomeria japonica]